MRKRLVVVAGSVAALAVGGLMLFSPATHPSARATTSITIPTSCTVVPLGQGGLEITLCL